MTKRVLIGLGVLVLVAAAAGGGFFYGRSVGRSELGRVRRQFAQGGFGQAANPSWTPQPGQVGGARQGGTVGTIDAIEGDTLVISTAQGTTVRVQTTDTTLIQKSMEVGVADLAAGERVMVSGSQNDDGSITARSIQSLQGFQFSPGNQATGG